MKNPANTVIRGSIDAFNTESLYVRLLYQKQATQAMHTHVARRARSEAAREADFDEHRADVRGFGCDGCDGRDYAHCA